MLDSDGNPTTFDLNSNFISKYQIQNIALSERYSPLLGIDATWNFLGQGLITKLEFKKDRNSALALNNLQINETLIGILSKLKEQNFNIACCSNSVKNTVDLVLQKLGIDNFFDLKLSNEISIES